MQKKVLAVVAVLIGLFLAYVATKPSEMHISREIVINAPAESIFPYLNNGKKMEEWMPWSKVDPSVKMTYSGPAEGVGSTSKWTSTGQMGIGQAEIIESVSNQTVKTRLTYTKPMQMTQHSELTLVSQEYGTLVRWSVTGRNGFMSKLMCVFINMDKEVGGHFEQGLATLKGIVEKQAPTLSPPL